MGISHMALHMDEIVCTVKIARFLFSAVLEIPLSKNF